MRLLRYSFYRFYQLMNAVGNGDVAEYFAIILMTLLIYSNAISLISIAYIISGIQIDIGQGSKLFTGSLFFGLLIFLYFVLVRKDKYLVINKEFEVETRMKKFSGHVQTLIYILVSILLMILCFYLMIQRNRGLV